MLMMMLIMIMISTINHNVNNDVDNINNVDNANVDNADVNETKIILITMLAMTSIIIIIITTDVIMAMTAVMPVRIVIMTYRQTSNISDTLVGNKIVDYSDVVGASPVGAAPTASPFSA